MMPQEVMIRRLKRDVMSQLPRKRRQIVRLPQPESKDWAAAGGATGVVRNSHLRTLNTCMICGVLDPVGCSFLDPVGCSSKKHGHQALTALFGLGNSI